GLAQLISGAAAPVCAKLSDIWGRKLVLLVVIVIFAAGSTICASATTIAMPIAGRVIQGSATGGLIVLANICISDLFGVRHHGLYLNLTGLVWGFASGISPLLGGLFTQRLS
ncbi:MFS general substrate transporter, partial [Glonium stellatum]